MKDLIYFLSILLLVVEIGIIFTIINVNIAKWSGWKDGGYH